ncbi:MAG: DNA primase [Alphaproteobacteria bacterium]|nr:MAG: DNA primase [Alphaproteobacteria bacterium]
MSFTPDFLDEIRARVSITDVVGRRVRYDRQKSNPRRKDYWGCCPFHSEKTPSFHVDEPRGFYHCFGCGEHGNVFDFVMKTENLSFPEAVERLAADAGLEMPRQSPAEVAREKKRASLFDVMAMATEFYQAQLKSPEGQLARRYLEGRTLGPKIWDAFQMGYAPNNGRALVEYLEAKSVEGPQMVEAGLALHSDFREGLQDRFRDRIIFTITDARGRPVAFGGRAMASGAKAKYLNSPETPLFHKGHTLYNLPRARAASADLARKGGGKAPGLIVAEGYMDVIALCRAGFVQSVAPLGTAMTEDQIALAWKITPEPILCFDGDEAGQKAAFRVLDRALPHLRPGHSLRFALLPTGQDPDDLIRDRGPVAMASVLDAALPLIDLLWQREIGEGRYDTPERRADLEARLERATLEIADAKVQSFYRQALRDRLFNYFGQGRRMAPKGNGRGGSYNGARGSVGRPVSADLRQSTIAQASRMARNTQGAAGNGVSVGRERVLVYTVLNHPELLEKHLETFADVTLSRPELDKLRAEIIEIAASGATLDRATLRDHLEKRGTAHLADELERQKSVVFQRFAGPNAEYAHAEESWLHILSIHHEVLLLQGEAREAEAAFQQEMNEENWRRLQSIQHQLKEAMLNQLGDS